MSQTPQLRVTRHCLKTHIVKSELYARHVYTARASSFNPPKRTVHQHPAPATLLNNCCKPSSVELSSPSFLSSTSDTSCSYTDTALTVQVVTWRISVTRHRDIRVYPTPEALLGSTIQQLFWSLLHSYVVDYYLRNQQTLLANSN